MKMVSPICAQKHTSPANARIRQMLITCVIRVRFSGYFVIPSSGITDILVVIFYQNVWLFTVSQLLRSERLSKQEMLTLVLREILGSAPKASEDEPRRQNQQKKSIQNRYP